MKKILTILLAASMFIFSISISASAIESGDSIFHSVYAGRNPYIEREEYVVDYGIRTSLTMDGYGFYVSRGDKIVYQKNHGPVTNGENCYGGWYILKNLWTGVSYTCQFYHIIDGVKILDQTLEFTTAGATQSDESLILSATEISNKLTTLQTSYPDGKYWNRRVEEIGEKYNLNTVNDFPCDEKKYTCKGQCSGFARHLARKVFAKQNPDFYIMTDDYWYATDNEDDIHYLEPGDIVGLRAPGVNHEAMVWKVDGDNFQVAEVWGSSGCRIWWGDFDGNSDYSSLSKIKQIGDVWVYKHPGAKDIPQILTPYPGTPFVDINTHWGKDSIKWAYEQNLFSGISDTKFSPEGKMDRAMLVTVLHRLAGTPIANTNSCFEDVASSAYYANSVNWASENGIVSGTGNNRFSPSSNITREQFATMLYRYAQQNEIFAPSEDLSKFADFGQISGYAEEALCWAVEQGIITGKGNGQLDPKGYTTRAEAAAMIQRYAS